MPIVDGEWYEPGEEPQWNGLDTYEPERTPIIIDSQPPVRNHWYSSYAGARRDFIVSAEKSADATGQTQRVHHHASNVPCEGNDHTDVEPDPRRHHAIRG